jgi:hypothetical protein
VFVCRYFGEIVNTVVVLERTDYIYIKKLISKLIDKPSALKLLGAVAKKLPNKVWYWIVHESDDDSRSIFQSLGAEEGKMFIQEENPMCQQKYGWLGVTLQPNILISHEDL